MRRKRQSEIHKHIFVEPLSPPKIDEIGQSKEVTKQNNVESGIPLKRNKSNLTPSRKSAR